MNISHDLWVWIGVFLTLCVFSFLYRDNPFYRFAEHLFVGISNGYAVGFMWHRVIVPVMLKPFLASFTDLKAGWSWSVLNPMAPHNFLLIVPALIGLLYFMRFVPGRAWLVRIPIGIFMGYYTGLSVPAAFEGTFFPQLRGTLVTQASFATAIDGLWAILVLVGVLGTLTYFFFSMEHKGVVKWGAQTGIIYIMVGFGASFGFTVMARVSLAIGRFLFLMRDWLGVIS
ncbi:MAG: hypothetical protein ACE15D_11760 [Candidatus Eisenbacteria bacterium]